MDSWEVWTDSEQAWMDSGGQQTQNIKTLTKQVNTSVCTFVHVNLHSYCGSLVKL